MESPRHPLRARVGLLAGPVVLGVLWLLPAPAGLPEAGWRAAAVAALMALWWITEAIPIPATALVPLVAFPLAGVAPIGDAAAPYAHPVIFLFLGGFMIAAAFQRWGLHRRLALRVIGALGQAPARVVAGFMMATALLSMWVSNTATVIIMLPIGLSVVELASAPEDGDPPKTHFALCLMLGIAYAATIGGLGTLIGTPPNALLAAFMEQSYGVHIGFAEWMALALPLVVVSLPLTWLVLTRIAYPIRRVAIPGGPDFIGKELAALGPLSRGELGTAIITAATALAWVFQPLLARLLPAISDAGIAVAGALLMLATPVRLSRGEFVLDWKSAAGIPWSVLVLFGGGLSLAAAINDSGLATWIGERLSVVESWPLLAVIALVTVLILFLTELTSNTATAAVFLPIVGALALRIGQDPLVLAVPAALAASCAFMLPVATPPNAIVYGSGHVSLPQMARAGLLLNVLLAILITVGSYLLVGAVLG